MLLLTFPTLKTATATMTEPHLLLRRMYLPESTLGALYYHAEGKMSFVCFTVELKWNNNEPRKSCIPEGTYQMRYETHKRFKQVYRLYEVPERLGILIHAANEPRELLGCIAPNSTLVNEAKGEGSRLALDLLFRTTGRKNLPITIWSGIPPT